MIERLHEFHGTPPTSIWTACQQSPDESLVLIVGVDAAVTKILRRLRRPGRKSMYLPTVDVQVKRADKQIGITIAFVGQWSSYDDAKDVVRFIAGKYGDGPRQWAPRLRELAVKQPDCLLPHDFRASEETVYKLCDVYLDECRRATES